MSKRPIKDVESPKENEADLHIEIVPLNDRCWPIFFMGDDGKS